MLSLTVDEFSHEQVGLRHKINDEVMIYPGYIPAPGVEPLLLHYGLPFKVGDWEFAKLEHHDDDLVHHCNRLFPAPPYAHEVINYVTLNWKLA